MRAFVIVLIHGLDRQGTDRNPFDGAVDELVHLVIVTVALDAQELRDQPVRKPAQARLRVADLLPVKNVKDLRGDAVACAALARHVRSGKIPRTQEKPGRIFLERRTHRENILHGVLAVAVRGNHEPAVRAGFQDAPHTVAQRVSLAAVFGIPEHRNPGRRLQRFKDGIKRRARTVVHDHDLPETCLRQPLHIGLEPFVRLVTRDEHGDILRRLIWHSKCSLHASMNGIQIII